MALSISKALREAAGTELVTRAKGSRENLLDAIASNPDKCQQVQGELVKFISDNSERQKDLNQAFNKKLAATLDPTEEESQELNALGNESGNLNTEMNRAEQELKILGRLSSPTQKGTLRHSQSAPASPEKTAPSRFSPSGILSFFKSRGSDTNIEYQKLSTEEPNKENKRNSI